CHPNNMFSFATCHQLLSKDCWHHDVYGDDLPGLHLLTLVAHSPGRASPCSFIFFRLEVTTSSFAIGEATCQRAQPKSSLETSGFGTGSNRFAFCDVLPSLIRPGSAGCASLL